MKEQEITVFVYSLEPFQAHISEEGLNLGITEKNVYDFFSKKEKPNHGVVIKFKMPNGENIYIR